MNRSGSICIRNHQFNCNNKKRIEELFNFYEEELYRNTDENRELVNKILEIEEPFYESLNEIQKKQFEELNEGSWIWVWDSGEFIQVNGDVKSICKGKHCSVDVGLFKGVPMHTRVEKEFESMYVGSSTISWNDTWRVVIIINIGKKGVNIKLFN